MPVINNKDKVTKDDKIQIRETNKDNDLKIIHWKANSINNKQIKFKKLILESLKPDIVSLNETKLSTFRANMSLNYENYNTIHRSRDENRNGGGGVAILINKKISYIEIKNLR